VTFIGKKHTELSNARRSATISSMYRTNRPPGMGFRKKYADDEEAKVAKSNQNRVRQLKCRYGMSVEEYDAMAAEQEGLCAICLASEAQPGTGSRLHVDHNHTTGKVRGLLCSRCNKALGFVESTNFRNLLDYIKKYEPDLFKELSE